MATEAADVAVPPPPAHALARAGQGQRVAFAFLGIFVVWLLLVGTLDPSEVAVGLAVAAVTTWLSRPYLGVLEGLRLRAALPWHVLRFLGAFLVALVRANLDVARRVLAPSLPIRPGLVEVETSLESPLARLLLANSITLTPGTLAVDVTGNRLLVHWIDVPPGLDVAGATRAIAEGFERHLKEILA